MAQVSCPFIPCSLIVISLWHSYHFPQFATELLCVLKFSAYPALFLSLLMPWPFSSASLQGHESRACSSVNLLHQIRLKFASPPGISSSELRPAESLLYAWHSVKLFSCISAHNSYKHPRNLLIIQSLSLFCKHGNRRKSEDKLVSVRQDSSPCSLVPDSSSFYNHIILPLTHLEITTLWWIQSAHFMEKKGELLPKVQGTEGVEP